MSDVFEKIYNILDFIGNFLQWFYDSIFAAFSFISGGFTFFTDAIALLPSIVVGAAAAVLCIGILYLVLGR